MPMNDYDVYLNDQKGKHKNKRAKNSDMML